MPLTDAAIANLLAPIVDGQLAVPYPGRWARAPYRTRSGRPVVAADPGLSAIVVDRDTGTVWLLDGDGESVLNGSPAALVACARRYTAAVGTPEADDDAWEAIGDALWAGIRAADPDAVDDERSFWAVAAEEVGYGMHGPGVRGRNRPGPPRAPERGAGSKTPVLLSMEPDRRDAVFTPEQWRRLASATDLTVAPSPHRLRWALDAIAQTASLRGRPVPRPEVLVCDGPVGASPGEPYPDLRDRLPALRLICYLSEPVPPAGPAVPTEVAVPTQPAARIPAVVLDGPDPAAAILAAVAERGL